MSLLTKKSLKPMAGILRTAWLCIALPTACLAWPFSEESNVFDLTPPPTDALSYFTGESDTFSLVSSNGAVASVEWLKVENDGQLYSVRLSLANPSTAPTNRPLSIAADAGNISSIYVLDSGGDAVTQEDALSLVVAGQNGFKIATVGPRPAISMGFEQKNRTDKWGQAYRSYAPATAGWWQEMFIYNGWLNLPLWIDYPSQRQRDYANVLLDAVLQQEVSDGTGNNEQIADALKAVADDGFGAWLEANDLPEISVSSYFILKKIERGDLEEVTVNEALQVAEDLATVLSDSRVLNQIKKDMHWRGRIPKNAGRNFGRLADSLSVASSILDIGQRFHASVVKLNMLHALATADAEDRLEALEAFRIGWANRDYAFDLGLQDAREDFEELQSEYYNSLPNVLKEAAKDGVGVVVDLAQLYSAAAKLWGDKVIGKVLLPYFLSWEVYKHIIRAQENNARYATVSATIATRMSQDIDGLYRFSESIYDDLDTSHKVTAEKVQQYHHLIRVHYYLGAYAYGRLLDVSDNMLTGLLGNVWGDSYDKAIATMQTNRAANMERALRISGPAYLSRHADTLNLTSTDDEYGWLSRLVRGTIPTNPPPVIAADFDVVTPSSGYAPMAAQFWDSSTGASQWKWSFGDGSTNATKNPSHTFNSAGVFTVRLTVYNGTGGEATIAKAVTVRDRPPTAKFITTSSTNGAAPLIISFQDQSQGAINQWAWSFGDGISTTNRHPTHTFTNAGSYSVRLRVTGPGGNDSLVKTNIVIATGSVGSLQITCNLTNGFFQVNGPTWYSGSGSSALFSNVPPGSYTVSFGNLAGYSTPASVQVAVAAGTQTNAAGDYASGADLSLRDLNFNAAATYKAGDALVVNGSLLNLGGASIDGGQPFALEFRLSPASVLTNNIMLGRRDVSGVLTGGGAIAWTNSFTLPETTAPGNYYLVTIADPDNDFAETDEANNEAWSAGPVLVVVRPSIVLTGPHLLTGGLLELTLNGLATRAYLIEKSDDLKIWTVLTSCVCTNGVAVVPLGIIDLAKRQQFFRAMELNRPVSPQLMNAARPGLGSFQFRLLGEPGKQFEIQSSTNLVQWSMVTNITTTNPLVPLTLPTDSGANRVFFRASQLP